MVLESFDFGTIRASIFDEFGIDKSDSDAIRVINEKINRAIVHIANLRSDWPFMTANLTLDVADEQTIVITAATGTAKLFFVVPANAAHVRWILSDSTSSLSYSHVISAVNGTTYDMLGQWLGPNVFNVPVKLMTGFIQLPDDFKKLKTSNSIDALSQIKFIPKNQLEFDKMVQNREFVNSFNTYYTVKTDPLNINNKFYLAVYPYMNTKNIIRGTYWKRVTKLEQDTDIPIIPGDDRQTIIDVANWYVSQSRKESANMVSYYEKMKNEGIAIMVNNYDLNSDPVNLDDSSQDPLSMPLNSFSGIRVIPT